MIDYVIVLHFRVLGLGEPPEGLEFSSGFGVPGFRVLGFFFFFFGGGGG